MRRGEAHIDRASPCWTLAEWAARSAGEAEGRNTMGERAREHEKEGEERHDARHRPARGPEQRRAGPGDGAAGHHDRVGLRSAAHAARVDPDEQESGTRDRRTRERVWSVGDQNDRPGSGQGGTANVQREPSATARSRLMTVPRNPSAMSGPCAAAAVALAGSDQPSRASAPQRPAKSANAPSARNGARSRLSASSRGEGRP
jgi:hypothetical protein